MPATKSSTHKSGCLRANVFLKPHFWQKCTLNIYRMFVNSLLSINLCEFVIWKLELIGILFELATLYQSLENQLSSLNFHWHFVSLPLLNVSPDCWHVYWSTHFLLIHCFHCIHVFLADLLGRSSNGGVYNNKGSFYHIFKLKKNTHN